MVGSKVAGAVSRPLTVIVSAAVIIALNEDVQAVMELDYVWLLVRG